MDVYCERTSTTALSTRSSNAYRLAFGPLVVHLLGCQAEARAGVHRVEHQSAREGLIPRRAKLRGELAGGHVELVGLKECRLERTRRWRARAMWRKHTEPRVICHRAHTRKQTGYVSSFSFCIVVRLE